MTCTYNIKTYNEIAPQGLALLSPTKYRLNDQIPSDAILLRSYNLQEEILPDSVLAIARAGAGVNNIPIERCDDAGVVVMNTPGANANAVKELVLANLLTIARPMIDGANWVEQLPNEDIANRVEAGKKRFVGTEIYGKTLGIVGLGHIGRLIANDAIALGMKVVIYDPYVSVEAAWQVSREVERVDELKHLLAMSDYVTLHVPLLDSTAEMINADSLKAIKPGAVLLNFARGELVQTTAVVAALKKGQLAHYVADFADEHLFGQAGVRILPHLGASTVEAEENCAIMAAKELSHFLETGNIRNSVNFPRVELPYRETIRIAIAHQNVPNMVGQFTTKLAEHQLNIGDMINRSRGKIAYTLIDLDKTSTLTDCNQLISDLSSIAGSIRVRVIQPVKSLQPN